MLAEYQRSFLNFAIEQGALCFGSFKLKSGRVSPWFFNAGLFNTGSASKKVGECYAAALMASGLPFDCLLGPAYKGIPLVISTAIAMVEQHHRDVPWLFNRKETKDHGEGGVLVGGALDGKVVILDDVITSGSAIREVMTLFKNTKHPGNNARVVGVLVAIDREERGTGELSAIQEVEQDFKLQVIKVVGVRDLLEYLAEKDTYEQEINAIKGYLDKYGVVADTE